MCKGPEVGNGRLGLADTLAGWQGDGYKMSLGQGPAQAGVRKLWQSQFGFYSAIQEEALSREIDGPVWNAEERRSGVVSQ